ncbi:MAG: hypothetical protein ABIP13_11395 [Tepidiformaceae bacterium]
MILLAGAAWNPGEGRADHLACHAPFRGFDFDTYELEDYITGYGQAIELAAAGKAIPPAYTLPGGETIDVTYQGLESGARAGRTSASTARAIPPSLYKAIAWVESAAGAWGNASGSVPFGGVGATLLSTDCGYGIGQITSGMGHASAPPALEYGVPSARQAIIGTHPLFNIAEGVRILADKWNGAPNFRPIAGNGDPRALEDWYYAVWSYNGFAFSNHPLNPGRNPLRGDVWHCNDKTAPGFGTFVRSDYTYQELVYGCLRYPPAKPVAVASAQALPGESLAAVGGPFAVGDLVVVTGTAPECLKIRATPTTDQVACVTDGTQLEILGGPQVGLGLNSFWNVKVTSGTKKGTVGWAADAFLAKYVAPPPPPVIPPPTIPPVTPANRYWAPQAFVIPDFGEASVAAAFTPQHFLDCQDGGFSGGCPSMDFPTTIPSRGVITHPDTTPAVSPGLISKFLGDPKLQYSGPSSLALSVTSSGAATNGTITVKNVGTWIAPFRVRTTADWIVVQHPGDSTRTLDGSVAVGAETEVVTQQATATRPRIAHKGNDSVLLITVNPAFLTAGVGRSGKVYIEPLLGGGNVFVIDVTVAGGAPPTPGLSHRNVVPNVASDAP